MSSEEKPKREGIRLKAGEGKSGSPSVLPPSVPPLVAVVMGSTSDWETMRRADEVLTSFDVPHECRVVSAHRTPGFMADFAESAEARGLEVIIAGAGGAAHLPGMVAAATPLPVIGVPRPLDRLDGLDSLLSIVQMPAGVPVATVGIGGGRNAGLLAVRILAASDDGLRAAVERFQADLADSVVGRVAALQESLATDE
jgi:5-(carboxyamino)imidazole ribonucleotide mutase